MSYFKNKTSNKMLEVFIIIYSLLSLKQYQYYQILTRLSAAKYKESVGFTLNAS